MTSSTFVTQLNPRWRIVLHQDGRPTWVVEELAGDEWLNRFATRSAEMLRWYMPRVGRISASAKKILAALPARVDLTATGEVIGWRGRVYQRKRPKLEDLLSPPAEFAAGEPDHHSAIAAEPAASNSKEIRVPAGASELTERFLQWRRDHLSPSLASHHRRACK